MGNLIELLKPKHRPVAIYHSENKPDYAGDPAEGGCFIPLLLLPALEGKTVAAKKEQIGCKGAWDGLGLGGEDPEMRACMAKNYSSGTEERKGRFFFCSPEIAVDNYLSKVPIYGNGDEFVVFQPITEAEKVGAEPEVVVMVVDAIEYSAMVTLASFSRRTDDSVVRSAFGFGCEQMYAMARQEGEREIPRMVLGTTEFFTRRFFENGEFTLSMPYKLYKQLDEASPHSFLKENSWRESAQPKSRCCDC
ncbi:MAG: DUF169 domain-containing protein [Candidatus Methanomethylophilaceae archaeon]|nr:DUF169 domain-containing protein [Candidatus Methanomethylophilaceae archaeon]